MSNEEIRRVTPRRASRKRKFYEISFNYSRSGRPGFSLEDKTLLPYGLSKLPDFSTPPCFVFDRKVGRLPDDLELYGIFWLVSDQCKAVFEAVDPTGFAFAECTVKISKGVYEGPRYWLCDVTRVLDALDEDQSRLKIGIRDDKAYSDFGKKYYSMAGGAELVFREDAVGDVHIFRMEYNRMTRICDQVLKDACKAGGLKGVKFREASKRF